MELIIDTLPCRVRQHKISAAWKVMTTDIYFILEFNSFYYNWYGQSTAVPRQLIVMGSFMIRPAHRSSLWVIFSSNYLFDNLYQGRSLFDKKCEQNMMSQTRAPCEDDFETIKLISNGAYGYALSIIVSNTPFTYLLIYLLYQWMCSKQAMDSINVNQY